jgi:sulfoxide reductase heme-binding subunit YedZ
MKQTASRLEPIRLLVHASALVPLTALIAAAFTDGLGVNPIQAATQRAGQAAILLLIASLACTPAITLTGWRKAGTFRRPLGLYAAFYAFLHFILFAGVDYRFSWALLLPELTEKRFILVGAAALLILLTLAATSVRFWMKRLGKRWKWLHRLVYLAGGLVILHYGWAVKGDFFGLSGNVLRPWIYGILVVLLLALRIPAVRAAVIRLRQKASLRQSASPEAQ